MMRKLLAALLLTWTIAMPVIAADEEPATDSVEQPPATDDSGSDESAVSENEDDEAEENTSIPAPPRATPYPHTSRQQDVLHHLRLNNRQDEIIPLLREEDSFYGLFMRERSGRPQGGALLLHDLEQHGQWPELTGPLREQLPEYGWTTLATELPVYTVNLIPPRSLPAPSPSEDYESAIESAAAEDSEEKNEIEKTDTEKTDTDEKESSETDASQDTPTEPPTDTPETEMDTPDPALVYAELTRGRIEEGLAYLNTRGQLNLVIIAHGDSAVWAALTIQQRQRDSENARGMALVMVDAREHPASALRLNQVLETLDIPVLDLITAADRSNDYTLSQRRGSMNRLHRDTYRQIRITGADPHSPEAIRRIRGWLRSNAAGTELP